MTCHRCHEREAPRPGRACPRCEYARRKELEAGARRRTRGPKRGPHAQSPKPEFEPEGASARRPVPRLPRSKKDRSPVPAALRLELLEAWKASR